MTLLFFIQRKPLLFFVSFLLLSTCTTTTAGSRYSRGIEDDEMDPDHRWTADKQQPALLSTFHDGGMDSASSLFAIDEELYLHPQGTTTGNNERNGGGGDDPMMSDGGPPQFQDFDEPSPMDPTNRGQLLKWLVTYKSAIEEPVCFLARELTHITQTLLAHPDEFPQVDPLVVQQAYTIYSQMDQQCLFLRKHTASGLLSDLQAQSTFRQYTTQWDERRPATESELLALRATIQALRRFRLKRPRFSVIATDTEMVAVLLARNWIDLERNLVTQRMGVRVFLLKASSVVVQLGRWLVVGRYSHDLNEIRREMRALCSQQKLITKWLTEAYEQSPSLIHSSLSMTTSYVSSREPLDRLGSCDLDGGSTFCLVDGKSSSPVCQVDHHPVCKVAPHPVVDVPSSLSSPSSSSSLPPPLPPPASKDTHGKSAWAPLGLSKSVPGGQPSLSSHSLRSVPDMLPSTPATPTPTQSLSFRVSHPKVLIDEITKKVTLSGSIDSPLNFSDDGESVLSGHSGDFKISTKINRQQSQSPPLQRQVSMSEGRPWNAKLLHALDMNGDGVATARKTDATTTTTTTNNNPFSSYAARSLRYPTLLSSSSSDAANHHQHDDHHRRRHDLMSRSPSNPPPLPLPLLLSHRVDDVMEFSSDD